MDKKFEYRGDLAKTALPEMLSTIHRFKVPGVIEARREGTQKQIFIRQGHVLHATSSDLGDSLGAYLLRTGELTTAQYEQTMKMRETADRRYGALLVENGLLSPCAVHEAIAKQVEGIVWSLFYWQDGEVNFRIGDINEDEMVQILLPMQQVILSGIKKAPNAKTLVARLGRRDTVFEADYNTETLIESGLTAEDYATLQLVDGKRSLYEICMDGPFSPADNAKLLYAFHVLRMIKKPVEETATPEAGTSTGRIKIQMKTQGDLLS